MKNKLYKIRSVPRGAIGSEEGIRGQVLTNSNQLQHETLNPIAETHMDRDTQFQKLVSMFQTFIQTSEGKQTNAGKSYQVEARDREVLIPLPEIINGKITPGELKAWTTSVVRTICSSAFNYFFKKEMNYEQTKIYCSENIFKNIVVLSSRYTLSAAEIELIDDHIKKGVLSYLTAKYPLTDSNDINKKLQAAIQEVDNIEAISNSYFTNSKIVFEYRDSGNYNDLIMLLLNDLMGIIDSQNQDEASNYEQFEEFMSTVFERVEDEDWMRKNDKEHAMHQLKLAHQQSEIASPYRSEIDQTNIANREEKAELKERMRRQTEEKEKYKSKVKEYTHYLIGRKIPENTPTYSQIEVESGNISIKSPTILRILTKWCGELHQKFGNNYFSNRSESVKVQRGGNVNSLLAWMRRIIDNKLEVELKVINDAMKDLFKNNYEMQTNILQHELGLNGDEFIDHIEKISGKLSFKVVKNLHTYIIAYLNRLIHGLMKASKQFFDEANIFDYSLWPSPPNLLTFRIGDLMRCKCSSKQRETLRIFKELQRISKETPQKLKIIRIKNRLRSGTNDILMNVRFNDLITCEIQLGIKSKASDFIKCSNAFHHYLYELQRSIFGPLTELCSIWNSLDRRTSIFHELVEEEQVAAPSSPLQHTCAKLRKKFEMQPFDKPFLCNLCSRTYHHNNYVRQHVSCNLCGYLLCAYCRIDGESEEQLKNTLIVNPELRQICKGRIRKGKELPQFGLCIFVQSKETIDELFSLVTYQKSQYLLGKRNGEIIEIYKLNSKKMAKKFRKKFLIFEVESNENYTKISDKQAINNFILPQMMRVNYKKEKESINLMDLGLQTEQCKEILSVGSRSQKETVRNLFLVDNQIESLPFDPQDFPNIQWLTFSRNLMKSFEGIQLLQNLKNCICVSCQLYEIPPQFYDCPSLQQLSLPNNQITRIDDRISNLKKILNIELSNNQLTELPESLFECSTLTTLKMDGNQLTVIPDSIRKLTKLEVIIFSSNSLEQATASIGQLTDLREIYLAKNYSLSILPESLRNLSKITMFDISSTQIASIPLPDQGWPNIRLINIESTAIPTLPTVLLQGEKLEILIINSIQNFILPQEGNYKGLKALERNSASAVDFPSCMEKMTHLTTLKYEGNSLENITSLPVLPNLQTLNLSSCSITTIPRLTGFKKLKTLNLSSNSALVLPSEGIELPSLEEFTCTGSSLNQLSPCMLKWVRLTKLDINSNAITSLFDEETQTRVVAERLGWPNLKFVNLGTNQLQAIPEAILNSLRLQDIRISSNQIKQIPPNIKNLIQLKQIEMNYNQVEVLPPEFGELPSMNNAYLSCNQFTVVPMFVKDMSKLEIFYMDYMEIKVVECEEWVLKVEGINLGALKETAQKLKDERENPAAPDSDAPEPDAPDFDAPEPDAPDAPEPDNQVEGEDP